jgi:hypothetical protein
LRTDNPFLVERHVPAAIQDYLISALPGARLIWDWVGAARVLTQGRETVLQYLLQIFVKPHSWDMDLIHEAVDRGIEKTLATLMSQSESRFANEKLKELIELSVRSTDTAVAIESYDFPSHRNISLSGELIGEEYEDLEEQDFDDEV